MNVPISGPILHPNDPLCHCLLGLLLDGRGARARAGGAGGDHPPHYLQQVRRAKLRVAPSQLRQGTTA